MSGRHHSRTTSSPQRTTAKVRPAPSRADSLPPTDLLSEIALDRLLLESAAVRAAGRGRIGVDPVPQSRLAVASPVPAKPVSTTVAVAGMTCRSCEVRIQKHVGRLPNVTRVTASAVRGRVEIESSAPVPAAAIEKAINTAGYEVGRTPWLERDSTVWLTAGFGILLVAAVAVLAQVTGLSGLAAGAGDLGNGGLVVALLLGLAAGVSTCMVLVGGLVLALSASFEARRADLGASAHGLGAQMRPALVFMAGRIAGYAVLGAALGAVGASVTMPPQVTAVLMVTVALVMTILGTRLTGLSPRVATWSPTLPMGLGRSLGLDDGAGGGYSDARAAALGAASFFLPCGFTQAVQIYALSTGSPVFAGALMATFAIGTAPGLLALAGLPIVVPGTMRPTLLRLVGVVVLGFALVNVTAGLRLAGITLPIPGVESVAAAAPPAGSMTAAGAQTLTTFQDADGYSPGNVAIYAGIPTRWIIRSSTTSTCAAALVVPELGLQVRLHRGDNTIELPALPTGTIAYTCAMGMYGGRITIVDRPSGSIGVAPGGM